MVRKYCATKIIYLVLVYRISQSFSNNNVAFLCAKNALDGFTNIPFNQFSFSENVGLALNQKIIM